MGGGRKTPCLVPLEGWGWWGSLSLSRACTHTEWPRCVHVMDGTQILWDTGLSPCFLIFQALWGTRRERSMSGGLSERPGQRSIKPIRQGLVFRCYQCANPVAQSWETLILIPWPGLCQGGNIVHYSPPSPRKPTPHPNSLANVEAGGWGGLCDSNNLGKNCQGNWFSVPLEVEVGCQAAPLEVGLGAPNRGRRSSPVLSVQRPGTEATVVTGGRKGVWPVQGRWGCGGAGCGPCVGI